MTPEERRKFNLEKAFIAEHSKDVYDALYVLGKTWTGGDEITPEAEQSQVVKRRFAIRNRGACWRLILWYGAAMFTYRIWDYYEEDGIEFVEYDIRGEWRFVSVFGSWSSGAGIFEFSVSIYRIKEEPREEIEYRFLDYQQFEEFLKHSAYQSFQ